MDIPFLLGARNLPVPTSGQKVVISRLAMTDMGNFFQTHRVFIQNLGGGGASDPLTVLAAGVFRDLSFSSCRAAGK